MFRSRPKSAPRWSALPKINVGDTVRKGTRRSYLRTC
jgi:hypothetical protein